MDFLIASGSHVFPRSDRCGERILANWRGVTQVKVRIILGCVFFKFRGDRMVSFCEKGGILHVTGGGGIRTVDGGPGDFGVRFAFGDYNGGGSGVVYVGFALFGVCAGHHAADAHSWANVALIVANSLAHGPRYGLLTVAGTSSAMVLQLALTALGMTEFLKNAAALFEVVRWLGVAYLLYLGIKQWVAAPADLAHTPAQPKSLRTLYSRAFFVSLSNPKTLFFFGAFFPQFVTPTLPLPRQLLLLSATFLLVAIVLDSVWALAAAHARSLLARQPRLRNRLSGGILLTAGAALALTRRK
jgi:homoserine/homoserine lactone efflux protein